MFLSKAKEKHWSSERRESGGLKNVRGIWENKSSFIISIFWRLFYILCYLKDYYCKLINWLNDFFHVSEKGIYTK